MARQVRTPGRLIAVDGSRGKDVAAAAADVVTALRARGIEGAVSRWDASGLFNDLARGRDPQISARTLSLVYAADLAFRLRWEIVPALEAGATVIAAPYLDTAIAFGTVCGLDQQWLRQLLRFAPPPRWRVRAEEKKIANAWKRRTDRGYAECAAALLEESMPECASKRARRMMMTRLDSAYDRRTFGVSKKGLASLVDAVTGSLQAAPNRSPSRPRSGRS
jgi:hypothetical protein